MYITAKLINLKSMGKDICFLKMDKNLLEILKMEALLEKENILSIKSV
jgi:hypothetical protein